MDLIYQYSLVIILNRVIPHPIVDIELQFHINFPYGFVIPQFSTWPVAIYIISISQLDTYD